MRVSFPVPRAAPPVRLVAGWRWGATAAAAGDVPRSGSGRRCALFTLLDLRGRGTGQRRGIQLGALARRVRRPKGCGAGVLGVAGAAL